jgi:ubiquitin carboxyl-terminal hydrolase 14
MCVRWWWHFRSAPPVAGKVSGRYELVAVVTHQGRTADGGHYVGFAKSARGGDKWNKFDDAVVTQVTEQEVLALFGGGT